jgi:hypothetical protein
MKFLILFVWLSFRCPTDIRVAKDCPVRLCIPSTQQREKQSAVEEKSTETYLNLTIKLTGDGKVHLLRATEVAGKLIEDQKASSDYLYQFTRKGVPLAVGFLPQGGFSLRGFRDPHGDDQEKISDSTSTTVMVSIPHTTLAAVLEGSIELKVYQTAPDIHLETVSFPAIQKLLASKKAFVKFDLPGSELANQAKELRSRPANTRQ